MVEEKEKSGFKQTEVGLIPNDWEYIAIEEKIDLLTGFPFSSNQYSNDGIKLLRGSNVKRGVTDWTQENTKYWKNITFELKQYLLKEGDIVIAMDGSLVGRSFSRLSKKDLPALLLQRVARIRSSKIDQGYLKEFLCSDYFTKHCDNVKTASAIPHISPKDIRSFQIPLPPTKAEQTAIATALTDTDTLITQLSTLIAKKKAIKQGAMQELLKPKEGWEVKTLGEISSIKTGPFGSTLHEKDYVENGTPIITVEHLGELGIVHEDMPMVSDFDRKRLSAYSLQSDDIVFSRVGSVDRNSIVSKKEEGWLFSGRLLRIRINNTNVIPKYLSYHFHLENTKQRIRSVAVGQTMPSLNTQILSNIDIFLPDSTTEQTRTAKILSDMDAEIDVLETRLEKLQRMKQGMMQVLLTGKIRLVRN